VSVEIRLRGEWAPRPSALEPWVAIPAAWAAAAEYIANRIQVLLAR